jgi:hypothetical protein
MVWCGARVSSYPDCAASQFYQEPHSSQLMSALAKARIINFRTLVSLEGVSEYSAQPREASPCETRADRLRNSTTAHSGMHEVVQMPSHVSRYPGIVAN